MAAFYCAVTGFAVAQAYYHAPNDTLIASTTVNNSVTMNITQVHPANDTLHFAWSKLSVSIPQEWVANICDNSMCYPSLMNSGETAPVLPGDDGLMLIHCTPWSVSGTAIIRYTIFELSNPLQVDTLTWIIQASPTAGIDAFSMDPDAFLIEGNKFRLPVYSSFDCLKMIDLSGKEIVNRNITNMNEIILSGIPSAIYVVELSGKETTIRKKIWYQNDN